MWTKSGQFWSRAERECCGPQGGAGQASSTQSPTNNFRLGLPPYTARTSGYSPRQIVDYLFSYIPDTPRKPACFRSLKPGMSMQAIVEKCDRPDEDTGSDAYSFLYHMPKGRTVTVTTPRLKSIQTVSYTHGTGQHSLLLRGR